MHKHLVNADGDRVRYAASQDFTSFNERSSHVKDEDFILSLYREYCRQCLPSYLAAFKSRFWGRRVLRRFFPNIFKQYLVTKAYNRVNLLFTLHSLRSEQNREIAICGIETLLNERESES